MSYSNLLKTLPSILNDSLSRIPLQDIKVHKLNQYGNMRLQPKSRVIPLIVKSNVIQPAIKEKRRTKIKQQLIPQAALVDKIYNNVFLIEKTNAAANVNAGSKNSVIKPKKQRKYQDFQNAKTWLAGELDQFKDTDSPDEIQTLFNKIINMYLIDDPLYHPNTLAVLLSQFLTTLGNKESRDIFLDCLKTDKLKSFENMYIPLNVCFKNYVRGNFLLNPIKLFEELSIVPSKETFQFSILAITSARKVPEAQILLNNMLAHHRPSLEIFNHVINLQMHSPTAKLTNYRDARQTLVHAALLYSTKKYTPLTDEQLQSIKTIVAEDHDLSWNWLNTYYTKFNTPVTCTIMSLLERIKRFHNRNEQVIYLKRCGKLDNKDIQLKLLDFKYVGNSATDIPIVEREEEQIGISMFDHMLARVKLFAESRERRGFSKFTLEKMPVTLADQVNDKLDLLNSIEKVGSVPSVGLLSNICNSLIELDDFVASVRFIKKYSLKENGLFIHLLSRLKETRESRYMDEDEIFQQLFITPSTPPSELPPTKKITYSDHERQKFLCNQVINLFIHNTPPNKKLFITTIEYLVSVRDYERIIELYNDTCFEINKQYFYLDGGKSGVSGGKFVFRENDFQAITLGFIDALMSMESYMAKAFSITKTASFLNKLVGAKARLSFASVFDTLISHVNTKTRIKDVVLMNRIYLESFRFDGVDYEHAQQRISMVLAGLENGEVAEGGRNRFRKGYFVQATTNADN